MLRMLVFAALALGCAPPQASGYRARLLVGVPDAAPDSFESWTEIEVENQKDPGRRVCEALVEQQVRLLASSGLRGRVERACEPKVLPRVSSAAGAHLLVATRTLESLDLILTVETDAATQKEAGRVSLTDFTRFASRQECQRALDQLTATHAKDRADDAEAARIWLDSEILAQEGRATFACDEDADPEYTPRSCKQQRDLLESLRARRAAAPGPKPEASARPACQPTSG